jgi:hypothetical protein
MRARFALVEALQKVRTHESVKAQLEHLQDMLRLCRGDNMGELFLLSKTGLYPSGLVARITFISGHRVRWTG